MKLLKVWDGMLCVPLRRSVADERHFPSAYRREEVLSSRFRRKYAESSGGKTER